MFQTQRKLSLILYDFPISEEFVVHRSGSLTKAIDTYDTLASSRTLYGKRGVLSKSNKVPPRATW